MDITYDGAERWTATLRPTGAARWLHLAFVSVWLCGWALGEVAVVVILGLSLLGSGGAVADPPGPVLLFLAIWLVFWTFGGISAGRTVLRLAWASDRIEVRPDRIVVASRAGPFGSETRLSRADIVTVEARPGRVVACTLARDVELTTLGTREDHERLVRDLRFTLSLREIGADASGDRAR